LIYCTLNQEEHQPRRRRRRRVPPLDLQQLPQLRREQLQERNHFITISSSSTCNKVITGQATATVQVTLELGPQQVVWQD
jgi:hypothetical protein